MDWKKVLLHAAESNASSCIHPVLKRPDEKMVTEQAYENPWFVEDIVRLVAADLYELEWVESFTVECKNEESIHLHDAIASLSIQKNS
jgi:GTP cyclohydrolase I